MAKQFNSVLDFAEDVGLDKKEIKEHFDNHAVARFLSVLRSKKNYTQKEIADKMGYSQSAISKLESSTNDKIKMEDLYNFANALGYNMVINFSEPKSIFQEIYFVYKHLKKLINSIPNDFKENENFNSTNDFLDKLSDHFMNLALDIMDKMQKDNKQEIKPIFSVEGVTVA